MSEQVTSIPAPRQRPSKPCVVCGNLITGLKPSHLAKRIVCSAACRTVYQTGENNPKWRGGNVQLSCKQCGVSMSVPHARRHTTKFCGYSCRHQWDSENRRGENNHRWKGGKHLHKPRYKARLILLGRSVHKRRDPKQPQQLLLPFPPYRCQCVVCGERVNHKRRYHPECRPTPKSTWIDHVCIDCGKCRRIRVTPERMPTRCRACDEKTRCGAGNTNWKGGITPENKQARASATYKEWRTAVFVRDNYTCVWCGQRGGKLNADHIKPFSTHKHLRFDVSNGRTLCVACHKKTPTYLAGALRKNG
jgi:hypothetical protein